MNNITCNQCGKQFDAKSNITEDAVQDRPGVMSVGILCPHCQTRVHVYFSDLASRRKAADVRMARARHQRRPTETNWQRYKALEAEHQAMHDGLNPRDVVQ